MSLFNQGPSMHGRRAWIAGVTAAGAAGAAAWPLRHRIRAQTLPAKRFVFFVSGNGYDAQITMSQETKDFIASSRAESFYDHLWWGTNYAKGRYGEEPEAVRLPGALTGAPGLRGFESAGLLDRCAMLYGLSCNITGGGHEAHHGPLSSTRTNSGQPGGETIDNYLARLDAVRGVGDARTPFPAIRLGISSGRDSLGYGLAAAGRNSALPVMYDANATWGAFVRPFLDPNGLAQLDYRERLLDLVEAGAQRGAERLPGAPMARYEALLAAARTKQADQDLFRERISDRFGSLVNAPDAPPEGMDPHQSLRYQTQVAASALEAGLTNVVLISVGAGGGGWGFNYNVGPVTTEDSTHGALYHPYSGLGDTSGAEERKRQRRSELQEVWARELDSVADLAARLDALPEPEGEGTMLDNTVIAYLPGNGVGHHASAKDYPTLLVGGSGLGLNTGNAAIVWPDARYSQSPGRRELIHLWSTLGVALAGAPQDRDGLLPGFGSTSSRIAPGLLDPLI